MRGSDDSFRSVPAACARFRAGMRRACPIRVIVSVETWLLALAMAACGSSAGGARDAAAPDASSDAAGEAPRDSGGPDGGDPVPEDAGGDPADAGEPPPDPPDPEALEGFGAATPGGAGGRSEEHTLNSSHSQISYAVFCLKKKKKQKTNT